MAEVILHSLRPQWNVQSAGTAPAPVVHPMALKVLNEIGLGGTAAYPKDVEQFLDHHFDYVITVCDHARETCPIFTGRVGEQRHMGFEDPSETLGSRDQKLAEFRRIRDAILTGFRQFAEEQGR